MIAFRSIKFNQMQKVFIKSLGRVAEVAKIHSCLMTINAFSFSAKQNKFFKKQGGNKPSIIKESQSLNQFKLHKKQKPQQQDINDLLRDNEHFFHEQRSQLPTYLRKLTKQLNKQIFLDNEAKFDAIYYKINKYSSQLVLKHYQYLQILIFIDRYLYYSQKTSATRAVVVSNGFEHRATMLAATFLLNRQFTITQAIAIFQILKRIGSISMLFLVNFTKFLKTEFQSEASREKIKLEHIITILSTYFLKNNRTILENVLYDMTLNYLLRNNYVINSISLTFRIELISLLMHIDLKHFYLSEEAELSAQLKKLVDGLLLKIRSSRLNFGFSLQEGEINLYHLAYLVQSCDYFLSSRKLKGITQQSVNLLLDTIHLKFKNQLQSMKADSYRDIDLHLLLRLMFNKQFLSMRPQLMLLILHIKSILSGRKSIEESMFYPLVDRYYNVKERSVITQLIEEIFSIMFQNQLFFPSIIKIVLASANSSGLYQNLKQIINLFNDNKAKFTQIDQVCFYILLLHSKSKQPNLSNQKWFAEMQNVLSLKISKIRSSKLNFIKCLSSALHIFRDLEFPALWLQNLIGEIDFKSYLNVTHPNQFERDQHEINFISITALRLSYHDDKSLPLNFNQHNIYTFLLSLFPQHHPSAQSSIKTFQFLQRDESFRQNMQIVNRIAGKIQKFYYLIWDLFICNYAIRSQSVRSSCFDLLKQFFLRAYEKQAARRVVLLATLTNYMSSGIIISNQLDLSALFQICLQPLVGKNLGDKFHYHCFLQIAFNARSVGILSHDMFTRIIRRCLSADNCEPSSFKASTLMLLYGVTLKNANSNIYIDYYQQQRKYLQLLLNNKSIRIVSGSQNLESQQRLHKKSVTAGSKFICVLLEFGQIQILSISNQIINFVAINSNVSEIMQLIHSFNVQNYKLEPPLKQFANYLNQTLLNRLHDLNSQQAIGPNLYQQALQKLEENNKKMNDALQ